MSQVSCPNCGTQFPTFQAGHRPDVVKLFEEPSPANLGDKYQFIETIGSGGAGVVYRARHLILQKDVAIKMIHQHSATNAAHRRFQQEGKALSALSHSNIVAVHDLGITDSGQPYLVMDWIDGDTLASIIRKQGALPIEDCIELFLQICEGLDHAHGHGILHRDLKPSNVMVSWRLAGKPSIKIVDFGIAKIVEESDEDRPQLTQTGEVIGSPLYMSPEQCLGKRLDFRSDLYSLGCLMFETLTGNPPFVGDSIVSIMMKHQTEKAMTLKEATLGQSFPIQIEQIVSKLLAKNPVERYQSVTDLKDDLVAYKAGEKTLALGAKEIPIFAQPPRQRKSFVWPFVVLATAALSSVITLTMLQTNKQIDKIGGQKQIKQDPHSFLAPEGDDDADVKEIVSSHPAAKRLDLKGLILSEKGLEPIKGLFTLSELNLSACTIPDAAFSSLKDLDLQILELGNSNITDKTVDYISELKTLLFLNVDRTALTDAAVPKLAKIKTLKTLNITNTKIGDANLSALATIPQLEFLDARHTKITDKGVGYLSRAKSLGIIDLQNCKLTDNSMKMLKTLPRLNWLKVTSTGIKGDGFAEVKDFPGLVCLEIGGDPTITDKDLYQLIPPKHPLKLLVIDCPGITQTAIDQYRKVFPWVHLEVIGHQKNDVQQIRENFGD